MEMIIRVLSQHPPQRKLVDLLPLHHISRDSSTLKKYNYSGTDENDQEQWEIRDERKKNNLFYRTSFSPFSLKD
jgi:hypothetical protein